MQENNQALLVPITQVFEHPSFNPTTLANDAMILQLESPVYNRDTIHLPERQEELEDQAGVTTIGWGTTAFGGNLSENLLEVQLTVTPKEVCEAVYGPIQDEMMCAYAPEKDSCQGDSGGPLIRTGTSLQYGIVSFGVGCGIYPGVYTKLSSSNIHDWILATANLDATPTPAPPGGAPPEAVYPSGSRRSTGWKRNATVLILSLLPMAMLGQCT